MGLKTPSSYQRVSRSEGGELANPPMSSPASAIAGEAEIQEHRRAHRNVIPGGAVVAGPGGGVALRAGISGACEDERALVALEFAQAFVGGADVFHAENVVDGAMVGRGAVIQAVDGVERHGLVGALEDGRLVHVIPKAGDAHRDEIFVEAAPPIAHAGKREIGEDAVAGPDRADENGAVGILDEDVLLDSGIVRNVAVARVFLDVEVGDGDGVETLGAEVGDHLLEVREIFAIDGKRRIALLVVDVEIDHVGRNFLFAKEAHDFTGARFGVVAVAALLVTEAPERGREARPTSAVYSAMTFFGSGPAKK